MKNQQRNIYITVLGLAFLASCANFHHPDVRASSDGNHKVLVRASDESSSTRSALFQATEFCESQKKLATIETEKTTYTGTMNEDTRKNLRTASQAARIVGAFGAPHSDHAARAGYVGGVVTGQPDYMTEMTFNCQ